MKIVIASDSFKGTLSSKEACMAVKVGLRKSHPDVEIDIFPVSDGGDGSLEVLSHYLRCEPHLIQVLDPCGEEIQSLWLKSGNKAFIEVASASGINLLKGRLHPLKANTYGTGQQILQAIEAGCDEIILFLGGSATTDCGSGILAALGFKFLNSEGELIRPSGGELNRISQIDTSGVSNKVFKVDFKIATDVTNPLSGKLGTAQIYAPQKGATPEDVITLERNLEEFSKLLYRQTGNDLSGTAGSGAAGGIPAGLLSFFKGEIVSGYEFFRDLSGLSAAIATADLVITGEGKIDAQTSYGKLPMRIAEEAFLVNKPCIALCGIKGPGWESLKDKGVRVYSVYEDHVDANPLNPYKELSELAETVSIE